MSCRCGGTFLTPILVIAGVAAVSAAGYRYFGGGCTGCSDEGAATTVVATSTESEACPMSCAGAIEVANTESGSCCPGEAGVTTVAATEKKADGCCPGTGEGAAVTTVASEKKAEKSCCSESKTSTVCKEGTEGCTGDGKDGCCGGCSGQSKAEGIAKAGPKQ